MNRIALAGLALVLAGLAACGKKDEAAAPAAPAPAAQSAPVAPAPPPQAIGESCSQDCGGTTISIQCAAGETPVCDCAATPQASCKVPAGS
jgi:hypothetical protein